jgi:histidinol dehydrogenase
MQLIKYPSRPEWASLLQRPQYNDADIRQTVAGILARVQQEGDAAVLDYTRQFDDSDATLLLPEEMWATADSIGTALKEAINIAITNIRKFHAQQLEATTIIETMPGVSCWRKGVPIEKVGLYIPGGTAPLFSTLLMLAIPANLAGCKEIILCTPPGKNGAVHPAILYAARQTGIKRIYRTGGAQAIAAMAYGTASIPKVAKIFGPGNRYVTCAKMLVQMNGTAIDMPAGPSELAILADESAVPSYIAADLLSQAEHGPDSQVLLVSDNETVIQQVQQELSEQLAKLPRANTAVAALSHSKAILLPSIEEGLQLINEYAPEHLIIACRDEETLAAQVVNAGSVFLGNYTPESAGDYASGTNHTLPTNGFAKAYSGVSVDSFLRKITFQKISREGLQAIGPTVVTMAEAEGLQAHANAILIRSQS